MTTNPLIAEFNMNNFPAIWEHYARGLCTIQEALYTIEILEKYKNKKK